MEISLKFSAPWFAMWNSKECFAVDERVLRVFLAEYSGLDYRLLNDLERLAKDKAFSPKVRISNEREITPEEYWGLGKHPRAFPVFFDGGTPVVYYYGGQEILCIESGWRARRFLERELGIGKLPY